MYLFLRLENEQKPCAIRVYSFLDITLKQNRLPRNDLIAFAD